ncbi:hypothetical protein F4810DRAFT_649858 [Camillea tinctor]|nr:hypothetical protein F4810DRAFT_649858 [Camillea tinctor]
MRRVTRVGHRKSRNGCLRCKARHVKCDEGRPCHNCVRHQVECSLSVDSPSGGPPSASTESPAASTPNTGSHLGPPSHAAYLKGPPSSSVASASHVGTKPSLSRMQAKVQAMKKLASEIELDFDHLGYAPGTGAPSPSPDTPQAAGQVGGYYSPAWMQSLMLMHHYSTSVYTTLSGANDDTMEDLWRITVPNLAWSHDYLMHGLLAISALHYAYNHPDQRKEYLIVSTYYQNLALEYFSSQLSSINEDNCKAYFLLSALIFSFSQCSIANPGDREEPISPSDVAQLFKLLHGIQSILSFEQFSKWIREGPLAVLFQPWEKGVANGNEEFHLRFVELGDIIRRTPPSSELIDADSLSLCQMAIDALTSTHSCVYQKPKEGHRRLWLWPFLLPQSFVGLIDKHHPVALIILAHYAAFTQRFENQNWILKGWGASVMTMVENNLDEPWREWIDWPKQRMVLTEPSLPHSRQ